jgi:hypothetical protein
LSEVSATVLKLQPHSQPPGEAVVLESRTLENTMAPVPPGEVGGIKSISPKLDGGRATVSAFAADADRLNNATYPKIKYLSECCIEICSFGLLCPGGVDYSSAASTGIRC